MVDLWRGMPLVLVVPELNLTCMQAVFQAQWGGTVGRSPGIWMRDDRIGGDDRTNSHFASLSDNAALWAATYQLRTGALTLWEEIQELYTTSIQPEVRVTAYHRMSLIVTTC